MLLSCHSFDILLDTTINKQLGTFQLQALFKINVLLLLDYTLAIVKINRPDLDQI